MCMGVSMYMYSLHIHNRHVECYIRVCTSVNFSINTLMAY